MKYVVLLLLTGCWQMTVYVGPRVDSTGDVGAELGVSMGASQPASRRGAVSASVDATMRLDHAQTTGDVARRTTPIEAPPRGTIRGVLEWSQHPVADAEDFTRAPGIGWRAGVYGGVESHGVPNEPPADMIPLVGASLAISPWVWGLDDQRNTQYIGFGVQFGVEALADGRYAARAAVVIEGQYLPTLW
jgi:hypothetical protein